MSMKYLKLLIIFPSKTSIDCNAMSILLVMLVSLLRILCHMWYNLLLLLVISPSPMVFFLMLWRSQKIFLFFKTGDKNVFNNYRPISLLPQFSKILEKLFAKRLDDFITKNNILEESQYGFRTGRSMAILELVEEITTSLDNNKINRGGIHRLTKCLRHNRSLNFTQETGSLWHAWRSPSLPL